MPMLKEGLPHIRHVHYLTDSPTSQCRNVSITTTLLKHESMFQLRADWLFFKAGYGKGPCDSVGGVSNRRANEAIKRKQVVGIDCAEDYLKGDISSTIKYMFVSSNDVSKAKEQMDGWQQHRVPNIMNVHSIKVQGPYLYTRDRSCYKSCCFDSTTNRFIGNCAGIDPIFFLYISS